MENLKRTTKIITAQTTINENTHEFYFGPSTTFSTLVLQNLDTNEIEVISLPKGRNSIDFIKSPGLNDGAFVKYASDEIYEEVTVHDRDELEHVLERLKEAANRDLTA